MKTKKQLFDEIIKCKCDEDRYKFLVVHQSNPNLPTLHLDNDDTFISFDDDDAWDESKLIQFDHYLGWSDGILVLMRTIGIKCESV